ncbi:serine hydrolase domain-containing protein [soil metagenome]
MGLEQELTAVLRAAADEHGVPGAAAGLLVDDEVVVATHGTASVEFDRPVTPATRFQVGSVSKTFASAAVMLLVQEGRLALEDSVSRHLPDLGPSTGIDLDAATVEHLLSHQLGIDGDHLFVQRETDDLAALASARHLFDPGTGYSYSNAGFSVAGAVVEAVSGQAYDAFVRERLLRPLGLTGAGYRADDVVIDDIAAPHWSADGEALVLRGAGWQPGWELGRLDQAPGGLIASLRHLLAWCRFQQTGTTEDGSTLLAPSSLARLHRPVTAADALDQIALDWFVRDLDGATSIGHGGVTVGYVTDLLVVPERGLSFVGLTNAAHGAKVNRVVRRWALERVAGIVERDPPPDPSITLDRATVVGRYLHPFAVLEVSVGADSGTFTVTSSPRTDLDRSAWQPPVEDPVDVAAFTADQVVSVGVDVARTGRFPPAGAAPARWFQWGGRRAPRIDGPA